MTQFDLHESNLLANLETLYVCVCVCVCGWQPASRCWI